jgi:hypothetical protein
MRFQFFNVRVSGIVCDQNQFFWILKYIVALLCFVVFMCSSYAGSLLKFLLVLGFLSFAGE